MIYIWTYLVTCNRYCCRPMVTRNHKNEQQADFTARLTTHWNSDICTAKPPLLPNQRSQVGQCTAPFCWWSGFLLSSRKSRFEVHITQTQRHTQRKSAQDFVVVGGNWRLTSGMKAVTIEQDFPTPRISLLYHTAISCTSHTILQQVTWWWFM